MTGKVFLCKSQSELLGTFTGQSTFIPVFRVEADDIVMGFYLIEVFVLVVVAVQFQTFRCKSEWITVQTVQITFFSQYHMPFFIKNRFLCILVVLEDKIPFRFSIVRVFACDMFNYCHGNHLPFSSLHISFHKYPGEIFGFHFSFLKREYHPD